MIIDCDGCLVRGDACGDCVVNVLLGPTAELQPDEQVALGVLAEAGLVPPLRLLAQPPSVTDPTPNVTETPGARPRAV